MSPTAQETLQAHLETVRRLHGIELRPDPPGATTALKFVPVPLQEIPDDALAHRSRVPLPTGGPHFADHFVSTDQRRHMIVGIREYRTGSEAREGLVASVALTMATKLDRCGDRLPGPIDICLCGWGEPTTSMWLVRANVFVDVASVGLDPVDVLPTAATVAALLAEHLEIRSSLTAG